MLNKNDIFTRGPDRSLPIGYWAAWDNPDTDRHISVSFSPRDEIEHRVACCFLWGPNIETVELKHPPLEDLERAWDWLNKKDNI